jgi:hypothetical protein
MPQTDRHSSGRRPVAAGRQAAPAERTRRRLLFVAVEVQKPKCRCHVLQGSRNKIMDLALVGLHRGRYRDSQSGTPLLRWLTERAQLENVEQIEDSGATHTRGTFGLQMQFDDARPTRLHVVRVRCDRQWQDSRRSRPRNREEPLQIGRVEPVGADNYATSSYSWRTPSIRSCRRTRICSRSTTLAGNGRSGAAWRSTRCGRWLL